MGDFFILVVVEKPRAHYIKSNKNGGVKLIRNIVYTVNENGITPNTVQFGGVQGDHNVTNVKIYLSSSLLSELRKIQEEKNGDLFYRLDRYNGEGLVWATEPAPLPNDYINYDLEEWITRYGGVIRLILVITLKTADGTELELYTFPATMKLKDRPLARPVEGGNQESVTGLAVATKENAEKASKSAAEAQEAAERTEAARFALEGGAEWIFDGGTPKNAIGIDLVVDNEMSDNSTNTVQNKVIKAYVDKEISAVNENAEAISKAVNTTSKALEELGSTVEDNAKNQAAQNQAFANDISGLKSRAYIVEEGKDGIWEYRKWSSGIAECWGITSTIFDFTSADWQTNSGVYLASQSKTENYPSGLFKTNTFPNCQYSIESGNKCSIFPISSGALGTHEKTPSVRAARCNTADTNITVKIHWRVTGVWR